MIDFLILLLSSAGLTWGVVTSKLFKRVREYFTMNRMLYAPKNGKVKVKYYFYWFLDSVFNCHGCFGFWAGMICYCLSKLGLEVILFGFIGTVVSLLFFHLIKK